MGKLSHNSLVSNTRLFGVHTVRPGRELTERKVFWCGPFLVAF
ncbi:hypothetical protein PRUB_a4117 [Pseudoalteromonas rubra]|uniref:Uncharacterized protein n=1 Tax=Pseudoalteromonas rubra TaxID=43658 RepID=A0A8T0C449_9GAMM|nr:hypothetical protein PRUB_a4117 [Pseudoalteromonas rubra]